jgi:glutamine amidotransferase
MCRHLAWLGAPRTVASLVLEPPHGLLTQSYAPRRQKHGRVNADGWGVGLFADEPRRWRSTTPLWSATSFSSIAPLLSSTCLVAAVRNATPGMPIEEAATAPFTDGRWLLSHNGRDDRSVLPPDSSAESGWD